MFCYFCVRFAGFVVCWFCCLCVFVFCCFMACFYVLPFYVATCKLHRLCSLSMVHAIDCNRWGWSGHWNWPRRVCATSILLVWHRWAEANLRPSAIHGHCAFGRQHGSCRTNGENGQGLRPALGGSFIIDHLLVQVNIMFFIRFHLMRGILNANLPFRLPIDSKIV